ncbi:TPA: restriction endonuclease subunit S [Raoultella planticola]|uniref:restriction endonuclease subunit S n=1 Tax=Klebsiella michiganensis TaxID=1134687 RepID=UPI001CCF8074|nr:restriction endonuclease subunit S [Klebsiella michiganensis]MBZ7184565.1 restriction endonuclease subunit S [Klebsiella michiganensis]HDV8889713.1 restriction endonuclease subunit S [Raoultella planticola]
MAKYKAYPEYKDSGVEWLGEVPREWDVINIKYLSQVKRGASPRPIDDPKFFDDDGDYAWVRIADVTASDTYLLETTQKMSALGSSLSVKLEPNKLFLSIAGTVGKPCITAIKSCIHDGFVYFPYLRIPNKFLFYVFAGEQAYKGLGKMGTQLNLNTDTVGGIKVALPSNNDFIENIVNFLDHETAKIDNLIEKQQQLIELLKEKRQAVISHAVTKGLNPDVPMKDSGVEWLGEVPEHWGVTRLKYECRNIVDCPHSTPNYTDEGEYPAIRTADILAGYLDLDNCRRVTKSIFDERNFRLIPKAGDIIYSREGERFGIGAPIPEGAKLCLAQRVMLFRAKSTPGYLMWALNSSSTYTQAQQDCIGATSPHVNVDTIKNFILSWPPEKEREEISNFIYQTLDSIESLTVHLTEKLTLLQERRTALISAAVTGKIDVRDWVAPDTQDIEEPEEATV